MSIIDGESGTIESTLFLGNIMGLEKFDDEIAEYLETKRKHTREALKLADLSDNAQLLMDLEHIFSKTFKQFLCLWEKDNNSYFIKEAA